MPIDAFVIRHGDSGSEFSHDFVRSKDFDIDSLKHIARSLNLAVLSDREGLSQLIGAEVRHDVPSHNVNQVIMEGCVKRSKEWVSIKYGKCRTRPILANPYELLLNRGEQIWYGPLSHPDEPEATWYIRPVFVKHYEKSQDEGSANLEPHSVRWL